MVEIYLTKPRGISRYWDRCHVDLDDATKIMTSYSAKGRCTEAVCWEDQDGRLRCMAVMMDDGREIHLHLGPRGSFTVRFLRRRVATPDNRHADPS